MTALSLSLLSCQKRLRSLVKLTSLTVYGCVLLAQAPSESHPWGTLREGRQPSDAARYYAWAEAQAQMARVTTTASFDIGTLSCLLAVVARAEVSRVVLSQHGQAVGLEGEVLPLMVSPWVLQLKLPSVAKCVHYPPAGNSPSTAVRV